MPNPSACGWPDTDGALQAGVQPGRTLTTVNGTVTLSTAGQVYQDRIVNGDIILEANNITLRNVRLNLENPDYGIRSFNRSGIILDHIEVNMGGQFGAKGIAFDGFTLTNSWIHNGSDCVHMGDTVTIRDTLCAVGPDINNDGFADNTSWCNLGDFHRDGFQSNAGGPYVIDHNVVRNNCGETSAISIFQDFGASHDIQIKNNLLAGGGYTLYCGEPATNEAVTNNRFSRQFFPNSGFFGPTKACPAPGTGNSFTGNVWDDTGAPLG